MKYNTERRLCGIKSGIVTLDSNKAVGIGNSVRRFQNSVDATTTCYQTLM